MEELSNEVETGTEAEHQEAIQRVSSFTSGVQLNINHYELMAIFLIFSFYSNLKS
jgi:hypothetical protein